MRIQRTAMAVALAGALAMSGCGVARVGNATLGEIGVAGSVESTPAGGTAAGEATDSTGARLGGIAVYINYPAVVAAGLRWITSALTPEPEAQP